MGAHAHGRYHRVRARARLAARSGRPDSSGRILRDMNRPEVADER
jgi:hypothetical protein